MDFDVDTINDPPMKLNVTYTQEFIENISKTWNNQETCQVKFSSKNHFLIIFYYWCNSSKS